MSPPALLCFDWSMLLFTITWAYNCPLFHFLVLSPLVICTLFSLKVTFLFCLSLHISTQMVKTVAHMLSITSQEKMTRRNVVKELFDYLSVLKFYYNLTNVNVMSVKICWLTINNMKKLQETILKTLNLSRQKSKQLYCKAISNHNWKKVQQKTRKMKRRQLLARSLMRCAQSTALFNTCNNNIKEIMKDIENSKLKTSKITRICKVFMRIIKCSARITWKIIYWV